MPFLVKLCQQFSEWHGQQGAIYEDETNSWKWLQVQEEQQNYLPGEVFELRLDEIPFVEDFTIIIVPWLYMICTFVIINKVYNFIFYNLIVIMGIENLNLNVFKTE